MPISMQDVAERAGVSVTTVSHVLNNTRPVAVQTRHRVLSATRDLKYYKNTSARLLARGRSDSFGLIISDIENPFFAELIKSFEISCIDRNMEVVLCTTNYDSAQASKAVRRMIENKVTGVAVMTSQLDAELIAELVAGDIPTVVLEGETPEPNKSVVQVDYSQGMIEAVHHLYELGHRRLGFIAGPSNRVSAMANRNAFLRAISNAGLPSPVVVESKNTSEAGAAAVHEWIKTGELPTAILCGNDQCAFGAMCAVFEEGLQVPGDVSIIGADDIAFARFSHPPLTTVRTPRDILGRIAFDALQRMLKSKRHSGREFSVKTHLVVRRSTGPKPTGKTKK